MIPAKLASPLQYKLPLSRSMSSYAALCTRPDLLFYRAQTLAIVRHFFEISCQVGRLPSILGREFFRARVSHQRLPSFEEQIVFVHDVERALTRLGPQDAEMIFLVGLGHYSLEEVAAARHCSRSWVHARWSDSLDTLAQVLLESGLLRQERPDRHPLRRTAFGTARQRAVAQAELPPIPSKKPCASVGFVEEARAGAARAIAPRHRR